MNASSTTLRSWSLMAAFASLDQLLRLPSPSTRLSLTAEASTSCRVSPTCMRTPGKKRISRCFLQTASRRFATCSEGQRTFGGRSELPRASWLAARRSILAGPIVDGNPPIWPGAIVENADQARRTVAEQQAAGYDFLKVYSRLSREAFDAVIQGEQSSEHARCRPRTGLRWSTCRASFRNQVHRAFVGLRHACKKGNPSRRRGILGATR